MRESETVGGGRRDGHIQKSRERAAGESLVRAAFVNDECCRS